MASQPPRRSGGGGLGKKVGPLPLWAWIAGGLVLGYVGYRYLTGQSGSSGTAQQVQTVASQTPSDATGLTTQAGSPADNGQTTSDMLSAFGAENSNILQAFEAQNQDVLGLAQSQIAAAQQTPQISPSSTSETQPTVAPQPGGSGAPIIAYLSPSALAPITGSKPPVASQPAGVKTTVPARYYTYKRDVPVASGQTVHYTPGRGYYAA